jgi:hypothetical protein
MNYGGSHRSRRVRGALDGSSAASPTGRERNRRVDGRVDSPCAAIIEMATARTTGLFLGPGNGEPPAGVERLGPGVRQTLIGSAVGTWDKPPWGDPSASRG